MAVRRCVVILGDQLDAGAQALHGFDPAQDLVWMAEAMEESTHVSSSKQRTVVFLSAMRHFAQNLRNQGRKVQYQRIDDPQACRRNSVTRSRPKPKPTVPRSFNGGLTPIHAIGDRTACFGG